MTIRIAPLALVVSGVICAQQDPARILLESARHMEQAGKLEKARLTLKMLIKTYPTDPLAAQARNELGAVELFQEGQERMECGSARSAVITFRTVAQVYPESPLAKQAEVAERDALKREPQESTTVRAIEYQGTWPVSMEEIRRRFAEREVALAVEVPYNPRDVERARSTLVQLLQEKGEGGYQVKAETEMLPPRSIRVVFTAVKQ